MDDMKNMMDFLKIDILQMENYILHILKQLNLKKHDKWAEDFYKKELAETITRINNAIESIDKEVAPNDIVKNYEKLKLVSLKKTVLEVIEEYSKK